MATATVDAKDDQSIGDLVTGILSDVHDLMGKQLELTKSEIQRDFENSKTAALTLSSGIAVAGMGALFLGLMLVFLLSWLAPNLPLWACFGIVGGLAVTSGVIMYQLAKARLEEINPVYPDESVEAAKENLECIVHPS